MSEAARYGTESHAYLLTGPDGVGKFTLARAYAQALLCRTRTGCGACDGCRRFASGNHPNLVYIHPGLRLEPRETTGTIKIGHLRQLVHPRAEASPVGGGTVVALIEQAERMTWDAANSLLKVLEEPPRWLRFVLTSAQEQGLPATVRSRCARLSLAPVPPEEIADGLARLHGFVPDEAERVTALAGGLPGRAVEMAADEGARERMEALSVLLNRIADCEPVEAPALGEALLEIDSGDTGRLGHAQALETFATWLRDAADFAVRGEGAVPALLFAAEPARRLAARTGAGHLLRCVEKALECREAVQRYATARYPLDALMTEFTRELKPIPHHS